MKCLNYVENKTSDLCGLSVKTSRFKRHDFCSNLFSFLHFIAHNVELPNKLDEFRQFYKEHSLEIKKYTEFCSTYSFKQLIKGPTRTTRSTSTFIDHILTNTQEYISQSGIIDTVVSDHSMVYCTRKISRAKYNEHKEITFRCLKNYSVDVYKEALEKASIPNYDNFGDSDLAYSDFISRLESVINVVAPIKTVGKKRTQGNGLMEKLGKRFINEINCIKNSN